jgi:hypothetical protein
MVPQNKLQNYTVLEYVLNFRKQFAHYIIIYFFAIAFSITNNDNEETRYQLIINRSLRSFVSKLCVEEDHSAKATVTEVVSNIFKAVVISGRIAERLLLTIHIGMCRLLHFSHTINIS